MTIFTIMLFCSDDDEGMIMTKTLITMVAKMANMDNIHWTWLLRWSNLNIKNKSEALSLQLLMVILKMMMTTLLMKNE